ncbi:hypothetical protein BaRGS_00036227, partial [Batillaria attramentaria]
YDAKAAIKGATKQNQVHFVCKFDVIFDMDTVSGRGGPEPTTRSSQNVLSSASFNVNRPARTVSPAPSFHFYHEIPDNVPCAFRESGDHYMVPAPREDRERGARPTESTGTSPLHPHDRGRHVHARQTGPGCGAAKRLPSPDYLNPVASRAVKEGRDGARNVVPLYENSAV